MTDAVKSSTVILMADSLDLKELGAATRILARLLEKKGPIPLKNAHLVAGLSKKEWNNCKEDILTCFSCNDTEIALNDALLSIPTISSTPGKPTKGKTNPLFPEYEKGHNPASMPRYLVKKPKALSIKAAIYDSGIRLLINNNMSEKTARSIIANWLNAYTNTQVAEVIELAKKQENLEDIHSWMVAILRQKAIETQVKVRETVRAPRNNARKEMTDETMKKIMERNQSLAKQHNGLFDDIDKDNRVQNETKAETDKFSKSQ